MGIAWRWAGLAAVGASMLTAALAPPAMAQAVDELRALRREIEALRKGQEAIQKDLGELRGLLQRAGIGRPQPPQEVVLRVDGAPFKGRADARVTLVDFTDYQ